MKLTVNSELSLKEAQIILAQQWKKNRFLVLTLEKQQRTLTQNGSMHLYFEMLAYELNTSGFDMMKVLKHDAEIPWNETLVKENLWKEIQEAMFGFRETSKLDTKQVGQVYEALNRHLSDKLGVSVEWPCRDNM